MDISIRIAEEVRPTNVSFFQPQLHQFMVSHPRILRSICQISRTSLLSPLPTIKEFFSPEVMIVCKFLNNFYDRFVQKKKLHFFLFTNIFFSWVRIKITKVEKTYKIHIIFVKNSVSSLCMYMVYSQQCPKDQSMY